LVAIGGVWCICLDFQRLSLIPSKQYKHSQICTHYNFHYSRFARCGMLLPAMETLLMFIFLALLASLFMLYEILQALNTIIRQNNIRLPKPSEMEQADPV